MVSDVLSDQWRESLDRMVPSVYPELRAIAHRHLAARVRDGTLSTTAVVHEAYLKLAGQSRGAWRDQAHFLALASLTMRHILIDRARARAASKRGGARRPITFDDEAFPPEEQAEALIEIDEALRRLASFAPRLASVVEWRFFGGMAEEEIAALLGVTVRTVQRDWAKARLLLRHELEG